MDKIECEMDSDKVWVPSFNFGDEHVEGGCFEKDDLPR